MPSTRSSRSFRESLRRLANHVAPRRQFPHQLSFSLLLALLLFALWIVLSGRLDGGHLTTGAAAALVIAFGTRRLLLLPPAIGASTGHPLGDVPWAGVLFYLPWLAGRIFVAGLQVAYVVLHPRLPVTPKLVRFRADLPHTLARLTLANSITLTPGTITVDVEGDEFLVHALTAAAARSIEEGSMHDRVAALFAAPPPGPGDEPAS